MTATQQATPATCVAPAAEPAPKWDLLLVVTSKRYGSEHFGTVQRIIDTALRHGYTVEVWACGYANMLTERSAAGVQPADGESCEPSDVQGAEHPSSAELIGGLVTEHADCFTWLACSTCSEDQGVGEHIDGVPTPSFDQFHTYVKSAAKVIYIGGA